MADTLLICISAEHATVGMARSGRLGRCEVFPADDRGWEAFDQYLARQRRAPILVMVDAVEEDYRFETLPHTIGRDRSELVGRRLRQLYRNTPYCAAWMQGRDSGKRRDDQYLFFALTNPELVSGWLSVIRAHELPVVGVFLLPIVAHTVVQKLGLAVPNLLLVSRHSSGLRLSFFRDGKLRISRLTRVESDDPRGRIAAHTEEIANTRLYLHALRVMTLDEQLIVLVLDRDGSLTGLDQSVAREVANVQATRWGAAEIQTRLGVPEAVLSDQPDAFYLHLLSLRAPIGNLAPDTVTDRFQQLQLRRGLHTATAAVAVVSIAWLALNSYQLYDLRAQQSLAARQTADYQRRYQEVQSQFPAAPTSADNLVLAVQTAEKLRTSARDPEAAMAVMGRALEQFPNVVLKGLGWKYAERDYSADGGTRAAPAPGIPQPPGAQPARRQAAYIDAEIRPFNGDYRSALDEINRFAETLRKEAGVADVRITTLPLNVNPNMALTGSTAENGAHATSAPFRLNLVFNPKL